MKSKKVDVNAKRKKSIEKQKSRARNFYRSREKAKEVVTKVD
jgi:hypothetical protein